MCSRVTSESMRGMGSTRDNNKGLAFARSARVSAILSEYSSAVSPTGPVPPSPAHALLIRR